MKTKALIVDDEEDIGTMLGRILSREGIEVQYCNRIESAIESIKVEEFQFYFLDLNLPDGSGFDLIPTIVEKNSTANIIIISAYDGTVEMSRAKDLKVHEFVQKPFSKKQVLALINQQN